MSTFVIVGAGLAGAQAAQTLREEGFAGRVVLLGAERERPYERPPLSKEVLRGEKGDDTPYVHDASFYEEQEIELRTGTAVFSLDCDASEVVVGGGERLGFDKLLLATGARPRRLPLPGADLDGIYELRTLADCVVLRAKLAAGARVAIVGAGWIGCEVAASAREMGLEVTVVDPIAVPLEQALGPEVGGIYAGVHSQHGVRMLLGRGVAAFEGDEAVSAVRTDAGEKIACDLVVVGVGVVPRAEIAERAGLAVADGIVVNELLQTSAPRVYAAGDVARARHPHNGRGIRVEHAENARRQGEVAARNMLGEQVSYDRIPCFRSEQYDVDMEYTGYATSRDEVVIRGDRDRPELIAFWLREGRVLAGMNVNVPDVGADVETLIRSGEPVDRRRLADPDVPLAEVLPAGVRNG